jgi:hypothetical protein
MILSATILPFCSVLIPIREIREIRGVPIQRFNFGCGSAALSRNDAVEKPRMDTNEHEFTNSNDDSAVCAAVTK